MKIRRRAFLGLPLAITAAPLHEDTVVINLHDHMWRPQDFEDMKTGGVTAKIYKPLADGLYWDEKDRRTFPADPFNWHAKYVEMVAKVEACPSVLIIRSIADIERAKRETKAGVILGNEGTLPLAGSVKTLTSLYERGLRELALYWPAGQHTRHILEPNGSLTRFASEVIQRANELGIVIDSSHLAGTPAFLQTIQQSKKPVIHTHGAAKFPRAWTVSEGDLDDQHVRAIADSGGVIGLHFCTYIKNLNGWNYSPTLDDLVDHAHYLVNVGGIDCLGIGADHFPYNSRPLGKPFQTTPDATIEDRDWGKTFVDGIRNISGLPLFTKALMRRNFTSEQIRKILGGNALRVFRQVWK